MTGNVRPASELTFNELQAADVVLSFDDGAGEYLYRDGITGREINPGELIPVPDLESDGPELEPEAAPGPVPEAASGEPGAELEAGG